MRRTSVLLPLALAGVAGLSACGSSSGAGDSGGSTNGFPSGAAATSTAPATSAGPVTPATTGATTATATSGTVVPVVAAENFWGDITRQLGGAHVTVTSIISDPNADPHSYETDPADAAAISAASFVVLNGVGYDDFASKLLAASPNAERTVISLDTVNGVAGEDANPHLWYDPVYVKASAGAIAAALATADPADAATFSANERTFLAAYQPYVDTLAMIKAKYDGAPISYTERVPGYLVDTAGLKLGTPASFSQSVEDGDDPSPQDTAVFDADITGKKVKVLLYNGQVTDQQTDDIKALASKAGVPTVGVTETIPTTYPDFQSWQIAQAREILKALGG